MSSLRAKVLFVTSSYPRNENDTSSVFLRYLAEHLTSHGVDVHVLTPADRKRATAVEGSITVHRFQYLPAAFQRLAYGSGMLPNLKRSPWLWVQVPFFLLAIIASLLFLLAKKRFDIIHAHWILPAGVAGLIGSRLFRVPLVVTTHGTDAFSLRSRSSRALKNLILRSSAVWTANTDSTAAAVLHHGSPRCRIIPMGVDLSRFAGGNPAALRRELAEGELLILFVGRLIESKGCHDLLAAVSRLPPETRVRTKLWVVGEGNQRRQLQQIAVDLRIDQNVRFFGAVPQNHLPDFYAAADLVVIPSSQGSAGEAEGQSVVALEALAARSCVVATRIGGIPSMIHDRVTGLLVEPGNPAELSRAMEELLQHLVLRESLAANGSTTVHKHYDWSRIAGDFAKLYREVMTRSADETATRG
jgi:teichuronic acid biosynthesis glycosyltransferase TuaC